MKIKERIKNLIPGPLRPFVRKCYHYTPKVISRPIKNFAYFLSDNIDLWRGERDPLTPPKRMIFVGDGDFKAIGQEFFNYFVELGRLKPNETVLDVGCGIGRMAVPLMDYLKGDGHYEGFDIVSDGIRWCRKNITPRAPNFHFQLADIYSHSYNPRGKYRAAEYVFPFDNETFDFVFLTSIFTHMMPPDLENYFSEISRVSKKGGRCLITFFLLNNESLELIDSGVSLFAFKPQPGVYRIINPDIPDLAVAFEENYIKRLYAENHMEIAGPLRYGSWSGRKDSFGYQDIVVSVKKAS
jgi:ubiquinone/menaquinone biosynthesis C-methylase UbiE